MIIITGWCASIRINKSHCIVSYIKHKREIEITFFKRGFTWDVVFHPTTMENKKIESITLPIKGI